jgi:NAD(P)H-dependent flavin oxidoreductase YrpB (nitropropane dioxygenase family)
VRSRSRTGKPARQLKSAWTEEWDDTELPPLGMPLQPILTAQAIARIDRSAHLPGLRCAEKLANYFVGQIVGNMNHIKPAATVVFEMVDEFIDAVESLAKQLEY